MRPATYQNAQARLPFVPVSDRPAPMPAGVRAQIRALLEAIRARSAS
jgi:hypothetical protein